MLWQDDLKFVFSKLLQSVIDRELEKSEADLVLTRLVGVPMIGHTTLSTLYSHCCNNPSDSCYGIIAY